MSIIFVPGDDYEEVLDISIESFTITRYCSDSECNIGSSKFRGKYQRITTYLINTPSTELERWKLYDSLGDTRLIPDGELQLPPDIDLNEKISFLHHLIESGKARISSQKIEENPYYNLEYWKKEYKERGEAISQIERETGHHVW